MDDKKTEQTTEQIVENTTSPVSEPVQEAKEIKEEQQKQPEQESNETFDKLVRKFQVIAFLLVGCFLVWYLIINPKLYFMKSEKIVEEAGREYFERNYTKLPTGERTAEVTLQELFRKAYLDDDIYVPLTKEPCSLEKSWVKVRRENGEYKYYTYLQCGLHKSNVDHEGPEIVLNGETEITIGKGEEYKEPGVKSVVDNKDGKLDVKDVTIKDSALNVNEAGVYEISYIAVDSLKNKTTVTRKVNVVSKLKSEVKTATEDNNYYAGKDPNNYIYFSGMLWRIVDADDKNVRIVTYEDVANVNHDGITKWLDYFYEHLSDGAKKLVVKNKYCNETVETSSYDNRECESYTKKINSYILSESDINKANTIEGNYLITQTISWLANSKNDEEAYTVDIYTYAGAKPYLVDLKAYNYGVRPVITIKGDTLIKSGTGTYENPYTLGETPIAKVDDKVNTRTPGEFIKYSGMLWRIVEVNDDNTTKVISMEHIKTKDLTKVETYYKSKSKIYNPTENGNVGYFIKNKVSEYVDTSYFANRNVIVPIYDGEIQYGKETKTKKYKVKLAAPNMYEMFSSYTHTRGRAKSHWLINSSTQEVTKSAMTDIGVVITKIGDYDKHGIRVVGNLQENIMITKGKGTFDNPYYITK